MDAKSAQKLTKNFNDKTQEIYWAKERAREERKNKLIESQAISLSTYIRKNLDKDVKVAASAGKRSVTYGGSYLELQTLNSDYMNAIKKELRAKGFKVECDSRDVDMGKIDIDYWGCTDEIRDMCVSW